MLEELLALGRLLGVRMEGSLAAVAQIGASLALDGWIYGSEDDGAGASLRRLEEHLLEEWNCRRGRVLKQIRVHNARMHHVHLHMSLFRIQHRLQVAREQNLRQLRLAVCSAGIIVFAVRKERNILNVSRERANRCLPSLTVH